MANPAEFREFDPGIQTVSDRFLSSARMPVNGFKQVNPGEAASTAVRHWEG